MGDAPAQQRLRALTFIRLLRRRLSYFLFQVLKNYSGAFDEESKNGADADTSRATGAACDGRWKCFSLSSYDWLGVFINSPNLFDEMYEAKRKLLRK